jgi:hypothetical protein
MYYIYNSDVKIKKRKKEKKIYDKSDEVIHNSKIGKNHKIFKK